MSRKDYELIARAIAQEYQRCGEGDGNVVRAVAHRIAEELAKDNPRFNRARFLKACEG